MATVSVNAPDEFSFQPEEWKKWLKRFERFMQVSGYSEKSDEVKVSTLIYTMGPKAEEIFSSFGLTDAEAKVYAGVEKKFTEHFEPKKNIIFKRALFNQRVQKEGEPAENFITALYSMADDCEYGTLKNELIRDRIVVGIADSSLSEKLQLDNKLTLETAISMVKNKELVRGQQDSIRKDNSFSVEKVSFKPKFGGGQEKPKTNSWSCYFCGSAKRHTRENCRAKSSKCHQCQNIGHFAAMCNRGSKDNHGSKQVNQVEKSSDEEDYFLGCVGTTKTEDWHIQLSVFKSDFKLGEVNFKVDSGACITCMPSKYYDVSLGNLIKNDLPIFDASGTRMNCVGSMELVLKFKNRSCVEKVYFIDGLKNSLLGRPAIESLGLLKRLFEISNSNEKCTENFPNLFKGLGCMKGEYSLKLKDGTNPYSTSVSRRIPIPLLSKVKTELEKMVEHGVIESITEPTDWCAPMVVIPKESGKVRICGDFTELNKNILRERFELPTVETTISKLNGAKFFSKLDANSGFYQIKLNDQSAKCTTFITPFGRYFYKRLPMGISSAPEHYMRRMAQLTDSLEGTLCLMDDICVFGRTQIEHDERLLKLLRILSEEGITLNADKCKFSVSSLKYLGYIVDAEGIHPDPSKVEAIEKFQTPSDIRGIQRFLGMINQLARFVPNISEKTKPLRDLLRKDCEWIWSEVQEKSFSELKNILKSAEVLAHYDMNSDVILSCDASSCGIGSVLYQKTSSGQLRPIAYASRSFQPAEERYATIEKESLAVTWSCDHFEKYLIGKHFLIQTDHRPLVATLKSKRLDELSPRLQRFKLRILRFSYDIEYVPGRSQVVPDAMSRAPLKSNVNYLSINEVNSYSTYVQSTIPISDVQIEKLKINQENDVILKEIFKYCQNSWPPIDDIPLEHKIFVPIKNELTVVNGILMRGNRLVIPNGMRSEILSKIHAGHMGISKCLARARQTIWWPNVSLHIKNYVSRCETCCRFQQPRQEPMLQSSTPEYPWQKVACDFFTWKGSNYFLVVDYLSRWFEFVKMPSTTSEKTIEKLKFYFSIFGIPIEVVTDGGPPFKSKEFSEFSKSYCFKHTVSSPYYAQSNGEAERMVGTVKRMLGKCHASSEDLNLAILNYKTTPLQNGMSPAQIMFGRSLRSSIPSSSQLLTSRETDFSKMNEKEEIYKKKVKENYDRRRGTRYGKTLNAGDRVYLPNEKKDAVVVRKTDEPRSFIVATEKGERRRTRFHMLPLPPSRNATEEERVSDENSTEVRRSQRSNFGIAPKRFTNCC